MDKKQRRERRKRSIRKRISGTSEQPRMSVHKSNKNIYVQVIDDVEGKTICGVSTKKLSASWVKTESGTRKNMKFASALGEEIAKVAGKKGIKKVAFDRGGYRYHGTIKALANAAREHGLKF
ncbi:MAG: 50S ribosomal protein L18 [Candidatus Omnitrophota bacterium]|nr:50S ribosomal protein L18 [Candidatus Omnitrophota bacterium]